jgi:uncharacterized membrane protein YphA (DoxX/SURF4 family)
MQKSLRLIMGMVFILAASFRLLFPSQAGAELAGLGLPGLMTWIIVLIELIVGVMLLVDYRVQVAAWIGIAFLGLALLWAFTHGFRQILDSVSDLFVFDIDPTDILLHFMYIILLAIILHRTKHERR